MKNLLVPTDFSDCAQQAVEGAFMMAQRFDAQVFLLHCTGSNALKSELQEAEEKLASLKEKNPQVKITCLLVKGKLTDAINDQVSKNGIDLIIIGSHGASGKNEYFIGSNTQHVVRKVHCSVLVIKEPLKDLHFNKVVFASAFNEEEKKPFLRFKHFVKPYLPEIHLVAVHTSALFEPPRITSEAAMVEFCKLCEPFPCKIHLQEHYTVENGIRIFAENMQASLIGISNHHRHPLKRMLVGSNVEALVNHSRLPVLCIDFSK